MKILCINYNYKLAELIKNFMKLFLVRSRLFKDNTILFYQKKLQGIRSFTKPQSLKNKVAIRISLFSL